MAKHKRYYGLFESRPEGWVRLYPELAFHINTARRVFQDDLLAPFYGAADYVRDLRVVKPVIDGEYVN